MLLTSAAVNKQLSQDIRNQWKIFKRILSHVKPYTRRLIQGIFASIVASLFGFSPVILLKYLFDLIIPTGNMQYLYYFCFFLVGVYLVKGAANYAQTYLMAWVGQRVVMDMRYRVFDHVMNLSLNFFRNYKTGELISRIINDISIMEYAVSRVLGRLSLSFFSLFPPVIAVFYISWQLALLSLVALPLTFYPILKFAQKLKKASSSGQEQLGNLTSTMSETFYGIQIVKAFNMEPFERKRFRKFNRDYYNALMKAARVSALSSPLMECIGALAAAVVMGIGLRMIIDGKMTTGNLLAFLSSIFMMYDPIKKISRMNYDVQRAIAGAERIFEVLDTPQDIREKPNAITLKDVAGKIEFRDVCFSYNGTDEVLKNIRLVIQPGETLALVGISGVGKSTLINMIPRFYDVTKGAVLVDDIDVRDITLFSLRENIGIVSQETFLFNDTVFNNICYGRTTFSEEEVQQAAKLAFAHEFIIQLPEGYDTIIGEQGFTLSGGQRQRLAIARALLKNPPILILDEATSSLDSESENLIQQALDRLIVNRTTIVIAHRLSTIRKADRIAVMEKGRITETGTHDTLMKADGAYKNLYLLQFAE